MKHTGSLDRKFTQTLDWFLSSNLCIADLPVKTYLVDRSVHNLESGRSGFQQHCPGDKHLLFLADEAVIYPSWKLALFRDLCNFKKQHNLSDRDFIFVANSSCPDNVKIAQKLGIPPDHTVLIDYYELQTYCFHTVLGCQHNSTYHRHADKDSCMLIGKPKLSRLVFMHELWQRNLLDNSITSILLESQDHNEHASRIMQLYRSMGYNDVEKHSILEMIETLSGSPDNVNYRYWNTLHGPVNHCPGYPYNSNIFTDTKFSIITESNFSSRDSKINFITEKTYKAIFNHHPFVIFGTSGLLDTLRNKGYKTFNDIIDESYDLPNTDNMRMKRVVNAVEQMHNISQHDQLASIVDHNYQTLITNSLQTVSRLNDTILRTFQ